MFWPCETRTSTCRSFATISSGLYRFLAIAVLLDVKDIPQVGPLQRGWINHKSGNGNLLASACDSRRPARLFFRPKCDVTISNWSDEREGQNEQVPAYSMRIRTAFVVCIRRGEITGAASRGKQPDARRRRCSEDGTHPCRCFWNKPADLLFLRSPPRLLRQRYQYPCYQATGRWHSGDRGCNRLPQLRKGKHPPQVQSA